MAGQDPRGEAEYRPVMSAFTANKDTAAERERVAGVYSLFDNAWCPRWVSNQERTCWAGLIDEDPFAGHGPDA